MSQQIKNMISAPRNYTMTRCGTKAYADTNRDSKCPCCKKFKFQLNLMESGWECIDCTIKRGSEIVQKQIIQKYQEAG